MKLFAANQLKGQFKGLAAKMDAIGNSIAKLFTSEISDLELYKLENEMSSTAHTAHISTREYRNDGF